MVLSKGNFAARNHSKGIGMDLRKTEHVWGFRVTDGTSFEDVEIPASIREVTDREAGYFGINEAVGLIKVSMSGLAASAQKTLGPVGEITTSHQLIRGSALNTDGARDYFEDLESYDIDKVHTVYNAGAIQEYWIFARPLRDG